MIRHHITKYEWNGKRFASAWLQINLFHRAICFWRKEIELGESESKTAQGNEPNCQVILDSEEIVKVVNAQMEKLATCDIHGEGQGR